MLDRMKEMIQSVRNALSGSAARAAETARYGTARTVSTVVGARGAILAVALFGTAGYALYTHPPVQNVPRGDVGVRVNRFTGDVIEARGGAVLVIPGVHDIRLLSLRDMSYHPSEMLSATGGSPLQSVEGLSFGVDLTVRYALDPEKLAATAKNLPENIDAAIVGPTVQGVVYRIFARYTVREIFSTKRSEIQQSIESELRPRLASAGIALRDVLIGKVDLPEDYRRGMDSLLAEELATEKMRYTLELKDKAVRQTELEGEADKVRREKSAEAAAREQIIAAKGQEEAMQHILPLKHRQIEQRKLEAEAARAAHVTGAEGNAQARRIEAGGEAEARQKLADAEVYRLEKIGKANAEQMAREGALVTRHPLLIQKTLADKLSDKIQVIVAPPPAGGGFIGSTLLGSGK